MPAGQRKLMFTGNVNTNLYNKYTTGTNIGALSTSVRRALKRRAVSAAGTMDAQGKYIPGKNCCSHEIDVNNIGDIIVPTSNIVWNYTTYIEDSITYASVGNGSYGGATTENTKLSGWVIIPSILGGFPVGTLENDCFRGCINLTNITFEPNSQLMSIGDNTFWQSGLKTIILPASLKILYASFNATYNLSSCTFDPNSQLETIGDWAFFDSGIIEFIVPASVTSIKCNAFRRLPNLTTITFEEGCLSTGGPDVMSGCAIWESTVKTVNMYQSTVDNLGLSYGVNQTFYGNLNPVTIVELK